MIVSITLLRKTQAHVQVSVNSIGFIDSFVNQRQSVRQIVTETLIVQTELLDVMPTVIQHLRCMFNNFLLTCRQGWNRWQADELRDHLLHNLLPN